MTKEEEETIKNIKIYIHDRINESVDEDGYERYAIDEWDKEFINDIETVLNMLKEKDKEIKTLRQTNKSYKGIINKQNKQIDLMADYIATLDIEEDICANVENDNCDKMNFGECEDCIKKFFERKSEEWKKI